MADQYYIVKYASSPYTTNDEIFFDGKVISYGEIVLIKIQTEYCTK